MEAYDFDMLFYGLNGRSPGPGTTNRSDFDICPSLMRISKKSLEKELVAKIEQSIATQLSSHGNIRISLSAGYDATTILAACIKLGINVKTFSYGSQDVPKDSDVAIARKTATHFGIQHDLWPMDCFSTKDIQVKNAVLFKNRANRCDEIGAWMHFAESSSTRGDKTPFFVFGDECLGSRACRITNSHDLLRSINIQPSIDPIKEFLNEDILEKFKKAYYREMDRIVGRTKHLKRWHDKKDFLYFHERLQKVILPWRECFASHFGRYAIPLLDKQILELIGTLPENLRMNKTLFRSAVRSAYPEFFRLKRATISGAPSLSKVAIFSGKAMDAVEHYALKNGLNSHFIMTIKNYTKTLSQNISNQGYRKLLMRLPKSTIFRYQIRRAFPPAHSCDKELLLSRLQIWLLREAIDDGLTI